jgi:hypothetical protein
MVSISHAPRNWSRNTEHACPLAYLLHGKMLVRIHANKIEEKDSIQTFGIYEGMMCMRLVLHTRIHAYKQACMVLCNHGSVVGFGS